MNIGLETSLIIIIALLAVISIALTVIIFHLKKNRNDVDWSRVYPELADMDDDFNADKKPILVTASQQLDNMLYDNSVSTKFKKEEKSLSKENMTMKYVDNMSNETEAAGDEIIGSIFAPNSIKRDEEFMVAVFVHLPSEKEEVIEAAEMLDDEITKRVEKYLKMKVKIGDEILIKLNIDECEIDDEYQKLIWNGRLDSVEFGVTLNSESNKNSLLAKISILINSIPAGNLKFKLKVESDSTSIAYEVPDTLEATSYRRAFISYASPDRNEVLTRTQMLAATGIKYFQDIMNLKPGEIWEKSLYSEIENADVFYLFWSKSAKNSEWVKKEYQYAKDLYEKNNKPEIVPIPIEGPPSVSPPDDLSHLHFNDGFLYFIKN
jgi:hypothetical protein